MLENQIKGGNSSQRDAAIYIKSKLDKARGFIQALKQREQTMTRTMQAIIDLQRPFFLEGDETLLRPMILKDVAYGSACLMHDKLRVCTPFFEQGLMVRLALQTVYNIVFNDFSIIIPIAANHHHVAVGNAEQTGETARY